MAANHDTAVDVKNQSKFSIGFKNFFRQNGGILAGFLILCVLWTILAPNFLTRDNILTVLRQAVQNSLSAFGMTFILIVGCIDLSVGANVGTTGVLYVIMLNWGWPNAICLILSFVFGMFLGLFNGYFVTQWKLLPYVVTLASQNIIRGVGYLISGGLPIRFGGEGFKFLGTGYVGIIPFPVIIMAICYVFCLLLQNRTVLGRHMYAVGGNEEAARYSGINPGHVKRIAYVISGLLSAVGGCILASRLYSGQPSTGVGYEGDAIASSVLGGVSMKGGSGSVTGTLFGALVLATMTNGFNLLALDFYWQYVAKGFVIILAVELDVIKKASQEAGISMKEYLFPTKQ